MIRQYRTIREVAAPLMVIKNVVGVTYGELVEIMLPDAAPRLAKVLEVDGDAAVVQLYENADGVSIDASKARFLGRPHQLAVSADMLGRVFDGMGRPVDNGPEILAEAFCDIAGRPVNPVARDCPGGFIQIGVSAIDGFAPLVRGQSLPIFSAPGLPHTRLAAQIARQAKFPEKEKVAVVFAAVGITAEDYDFFMREFGRGGAIDRMATFVTLADDPPAQRIVVPTVAMTAAEQLAFEHDMDVLVIMTDMMNHADALREVSAASGETPGRRGYPGCLHAELASIYERAGRRVGKSGSVTLLPILTVPDGDENHPVADMTGYTTEGRIVLSPDLMRRGVTPPVDVLASSSRFGGSRGSDDVTDRLFEAYLKKDAEFCDAFEARFVSQGCDEDRTIEETLKIGRELLESHENL